VEIDQGNKKRQRSITGLQSQLKKKNISIKYNRSEKKVLRKLYGTKKDK
jgi:hypothetical protein